MTRNLGKINTQQIQQLAPDSNFLTLLCIFPTPFDVIPTKFIVLIFSISLPCSSGLKRVGKTLRSLYIVQKSMCERALIINALLQIKHKIKKRIKSIQQEQKLILWKNQKKYEIIYFIIDATFALYFYFSIFLLRFSSYNCALQRSQQNSVSFSQFFLFYSNIISLRVFCYQLSICYVSMIVTFLYSDIFPFSILYTVYIIWNQMKKLLNISAFIVGLGAVGYTYISYKTSSNYSDYITEFKQLEKLGDAANSIYLTPKRAEVEHITNKFKTGDNLFLKYNYGSTFTWQNYLKGFVNTYFGSSNQFHSVGYIYKNNTGTYVLYNDLTTTQVQKIDQFLNLPFLLHVFFQPNTKTVDFQSKLKELVENESGVVSMKPIKQEPVDMVNRINKILYQKQYQFSLDFRVLVKDSSNLFPIKTRLQRYFERKRTK